MRSERVAARCVVAAAVVVAVLGALTACGSETDAGSPPSAEQTGREAQFNDADVAFVLAAGNRLGQTLTAAKLAEVSSADPAVRRLAQAVVAAKGPQVDRVASWLRSWGKQGADFGHDVTVQDDPDPRGGLTDATMARLPTLTGPQFDQLFLGALAAHLDADEETWAVEARDGTHPAATELAESLMTEERDLARQARALLPSG